MQLNEIIERFGYDGVHQQTMISIRNLEQLISRDVENIPRVKAMGLISILEREYRIDLVSLKNEFNELYEHIPETLNFDPAKVIQRVETDEKGGTILSKLLLMIPVLVLVFVAWFFFIRDESMKTLFKSDENSTSLLDSVAKQVKDSISKNEQPDTKVSLSSEENSTATEHNMTDEEKIISELKREQEKIIQKEKSQTEEKKKKEQATSSEPKTDETPTIDKIINAADSMPSVPDPVDANTTVEAESKPANSERGKQEQLFNISDETQNKVVNSDDMPAQEPAKQQIDEPVQENKFKAAVQEPAPKLQSKPKEAPKPDKPVQKKVPAVKIKSTATKVVFHPKGKVWVGYRDLKTMKKVSVLLNAGEDFALKSGGRRYILAAGNRNFSFYVRGKLAKPGKINGSVYYEISNGRITPLTKDEFQALNQSTEW